MRKFLYLLAFLPCAVFAQSTDYSLDKSHAFEHMEIGATVGSTGVGLDVGFPINKNLKLRGGFSFMPKLSNTGHYEMKKLGVLQGTDKQIDHKTRRLVQLLGEFAESFLGRNDVDSIVDMERSASYINGKLILDWYPFAKKNWHFSAGFYVGSRKTVTFCNTDKELATTYAMKAYNKTYDQVQTLDEYEYPFYNFGDISYELDPYVGEYLKDGFKYYGRIGMKVGEFADGSYFYLDPDQNGYLKAEMFVNAFKPYVGFGYDTRIGKDKRWNFGFDAGLLIWGKPKVYCNGYVGDEKGPTDITYDEYGRNPIINRRTVDLLDEVEVTSKVIKKYTKIAHNLPIFPVLEVKLSYNIF